jgi:PKD repeat protein
MDALKSFASRIALIAVLACFAQASSALADGGGGSSFSWSPSFPYTQESVTFTSTSNASGQTWSFGSKATPQTASGKTATATFSKSGVYSVTLNVPGENAISKTIYVLNRPPIAGFAFSPDHPAPGQVVAFDAGPSSDPDGSIKAWDWDWNNDGTWDDHGKTAARSFTRGLQTVVLRVTDDGNATSTAKLQFTVDSYPSAGFTTDPATPVAGQAVIFTAHSAPAEGGSIVAQAWDLNGDGRFDDGTASTATTTFTPGNHTVSLRVLDDLGLSTVAFRMFAVAEPAGPGPTTGDDGAAGHGDGGGSPASGGVKGFTQSGGFAALNPRPFIHIKGRTTGRGALIDLFTVRAPSGAEVVLRCNGKRCPIKARRARVGGSGIGIVRFRAVEKLLRVGIVLQVEVTKQGFVGRVTRFRIGRLKPPVRWDGCLVPGHNGPADCQGGM